jgi:hypothetical protein
VVRLILVLALLMLSAATSSPSSANHVNQAGRSDQYREQKDSTSAPMPITAPQLGTNKPTYAIDHYTYNAYNNSQPTKSDWWTVVVGIATAVMGAFTVALWWTSHKQWQVASDALVKLERPWVLALPKAIILKPCNNAMIARIQIAFCNNGRSPAWLLTGGIQPFKGEVVLADEPVYVAANIEFHQTPLAPDGKSTYVDEVRQYVVGTTGEGGTYPSFENGTRKIGIYGYVTYRDALNKEPHETRFCMFLDPPLGERPVRLIFGGPQAYNRYT